MLYLVELDAAYKVGYSATVETRINQYKTGNVIVNLIDTREGNYNNEKEIHLALKDYNIKSELFQKDPEVIRIFREYILTEQLEESQEIIKLNKQIREEIKVLSRAIR